MVESDSGLPESKVTVQLEGGAPEADLSDRTVAGEVTEYIWIKRGDAERRYEFSLDAPDGPFS